MTRPKSKRRPRTCLLLEHVPRKRGEYVAHLYRTPYDPEAGATQEELADDSVARLTDGEQGRYIGALPIRALCGKRVRVGASGYTQAFATRDCPGCFALKP